MLQKRQGYIGWDNDEEDIFVKSHSDGGKEKDHLQAWSVCFSDDGAIVSDLCIYILTTMMAALGWFIYIYMPSIDRSRSLHD